MSVVRIVVYVVLVLVILVLLRITWEVFQYTQPPYACQEFGGSWSFLDGWSCG
jgi:hypothetical protein